VVVAVGNFGPVDFDDASSGFDQSASQQAALAEGVVAVLFAKFSGFGGQVESFASFA